MEENKAPKTRFYFRSIDGLRLIASVNIVVFHLSAMGGFEDLHGSPGWFFALIKGPAFHASLFFILGGFIFTVKYGETHHVFDSVRFLVRRFQALYPLHVITTLLMVPFVILAGFEEGRVALGKLIASLFMHLGMLWSFFPFGTYAFNRPSWALSAFFLCYLLLGPSLKVVMRLDTRRSVFLSMFAAMGVLGIWALTFITVDGRTHYQFFHIFAPARFFEFVIGMLLARLYYLNNARPRKLEVKQVPLLNDLIIIAICVSIFLLLRHVAPMGIGWRYVNYHVFVIPLFATLLYRFARGNGAIPSFFALPVVRKLGVCSFYPYLVHIPLASWIGYTCEHAFGYYRFFHSPLNVVVFLVFLYGGSAFFWEFFRARKQKR